ncbi:hypothetical protein [Qipengyuania atrilutea]|uniref:Uncharacterized protein n=1 Tax=Qipengyuania atrilutea TaxID=2744473 RepID=A0A850H3I4_9SPHN|nr:hypothetical protein [Actirhodobacter atriluteus]NVD44448.1 hypothetical protein [Actirhodobacter atriluteus]
MTLSLSGLVRILVIGALLAVLAVAGWLYVPTLARLVSPEGRETSGQARIESRSLVYRLNPAAPVRFVFSQPVPSVRILSAPLIELSSWEREARWTYGYRVTLRDGSGSVLASHEVYSSGSHPQKLEQPLPWTRFFRGADGFVATQDQAIIDSGTEIASLEIAPLPSDQGVTAIDVRAYEQRPFLSRGDALAAFRRRSGDEQRDLARANAFPEEFIGDDERANIAINLWRPIGPVGIAGEDYEVGVMYQSALDEAP